MSAQDTAALKELVRFMATQLVDHPDDLEVTDVQEGDTTVFELDVADDDLGKVIGKQGRTARAMRTLLSAAASRTRRRVSLEILE